MPKPGSLIVFEGPDAVGKSTLAKEFASVLAGRGTPCDLLAFPGREAGTLGLHVYQLHHDPERFGIANIPAASLQLLHVAAHLDAITNRILPALRSGRWVVLDRFWWSTWVYGRVAGACKETLDAMIAVEKAEWGDVTPVMAFLVRRGRPLRDGEPLDCWQNLVLAYRELAMTERARQSVCMLDNEGTVEDAVGRTLNALDGLRN